MTIYSRYLKLLQICCTLFLISACSSSPRVTFYTLAPVLKSHATEQPTVAPSVSIVSVTMPELVDRPQLVVKIDDSRVEILEMHRWAEPLKSALPRVMAENLSNRLGTGVVSSYRQHGAKESDFLLSVDINRFSATGSSVSVAALWSLKRTKDGKIKIGSSDLSETVTGTGQDSVVSAYSRAIAAMGREIAKALHDDWPTLR